MWELRQLRRAFYWGQQRGRTPDTHWPAAEISPTPFFRECSRFPQQMQKPCSASLVFLDPTWLALGTARSFLCYPFVISAVRSFHFYSGQAFFFNRVCVSEKVTFLCDVNGGRKNLHLLCQEAQNIFLLSNYLDSLMDEIYLVLCWTTS